MAVQASVVHEDDYSLLKDLKLEVDSEECTFSLCFWIYLSTSTCFPATIIRQMHSGSEGDAPFLVLNKEKKLTLLPLLFLHEEASCPGSSTSWTEVPCVPSEVDCPLAKWIHVGCEYSASNSVKNTVIVNSQCIISDRIGEQDASSPRLTSLPLEKKVPDYGEVSKNFVRLHIDGVVIGEKPLSSSSKDDSNMDDVKKVSLAGADGDDGKLQGFVHYPRILPLASSIQDHFVKNPPIELSIDSSCLSEIEEGGDGVWSIVGGKASCRRNFSLDVVLLDAFGHPVNKEMEVVASLLYDDNGMPVEKPNDAEAPLLTSYDGIEFACFVRPSKLLHGRASFKLKISQLSSKCDNRLFRIRFDFPKNGGYPFLEAYSHPIRCISRSRNTRTSSLPWKKSTSLAQLDGAQLLALDDGSPENQQAIGDGHFPIFTARESKSSPPLKRVKLGAEKLSVRIQVDPNAEHPDARFNSHAMNTNQGENGFGTSFEGKRENLEGTDNTPSDSESVQAKKSAFKMTSTKNPISDVTVFKYCLGGMNQRSLLLRELVASSTDQEMASFGQQVSLYTGCSHHRYQISMAKRLVQEGTDAWDSISEGNHHILWENVVVEIEEQFMKISGCSTRCLMEKDFQLLRRIAGCRDYVTRESFDRMWHWLYPVAFTLSRDWITATWGCTSPKWIEGLITKEEAEVSLRGPRGLQEPGTFLLRFPTSRSWPHPDAGSLIVTYVGDDCTLRHRLLSLDYREVAKKPLQVLILEEPQLRQLGRVTR